MPFVRPGPDKSLWGVLLEKAAAKMDGSYEAMQGGIPTEGIRKLTGYPGHMIAHEEIEDADALWTKIQKAHKKGALVTSGSHYNA